MDSLILYIRFHFPWLHGLILRLFAILGSFTDFRVDTALNRVPALEAQKKMWCSRTPMNRLGNVDELNSIAVFLASNASTFMTGSDLIIDVCFH